jgi:predicted amidohydrolase YtcJ
MGQRAGAIDLERTESAEDVYQRLQHVDLHASFTDWVIGQGFNDRYWGGAPLSRARLDEMFPDTPVCLFRSALHAAQVNSEALRRAGIGDGFRAGRGGRVGVDDDGKLTGLLVDEALEPVRQAIPPRSEDEDRYILMECAEMLHSFGIASAHMAKMSPERLPFLRRLRDTGELPLRIFTMIDGAVLDYDDPGFEPFRDPEAWASWTTIKFFADGALGSLGGLVIDTYRDGSKGLQLYTAEDFQRIFPKLTGQGWQLAVHAIGDQAARNVLDGFAACPSEELRQIRPRLEHSQMMAVEDIERMSDLSTISSIQPIHLHDDCVWAHEVLAPFQLDRLYDFDRLAANAPLAGGSDYPVADANPWHGISCAMTRKTGSGDVFHPEKGLPRKAILEAYTSGAAYAAHWEDQIGQLHAGFKADVIVLDRDPFEESAESIWDTEVLDMWIEGEPVESLYS